MLKLLLGLLSFVLLSFSVARADSKPVRPSTITVGDAVVTFGGGDGPGSGSCASGTCSASRGRFHLFRNRTPILKRRGGPGLFHRRGCR